MDERRSWVSTYAPPIVSALIGSIAGGLISGSAAIFIMSQTEASAKLNEQRSFESRLIVVEQAVKDQADVRHELIALANAVTGAATELRDLKAEVEWMRNSEVKISPK